jgi:hypothetical protein
VDEIARQIREQCDEQIGLASVAVRDRQEESEDIEKDLRVILNVSTSISVVV